MPRTKEVEYYRLWAGSGGDTGTWDTAYIEIPGDTPDEKLDEAIRAAAEKVEWRDGEAPVIVGLYCDNGPEELDEDDEYDGPVCRECGEPCFVTEAGVAHHGRADLVPEIDHDADADHVAIPEEE